MIFDLRVEHGTLRVFVLAAEGAEGAPVDLDGKGMVAQEVADRGLVIVHKAALHGGIGVGGEASLGKGGRGERAEQEGGQVNCGGREKMRQLHDGSSLDMLLERVRDQLATESFLLRRMEGRRWFAAHTKCPTTDTSGDM